MSDQRFALTDLTIVAQDGYRANTAILIHNDRIEAVSEEVPIARDIPRVSLGGAYVIPGLINVHSHLTFFAGADTASDAQIAFKATQQAKDALLAGITTVRDIGGMRHIDIALRDAIRDEHIAGPRLLVCGKIICMTGGHTYPRAREADGVTDVRRAVREQVKAGADFIKFMASGGVARPEESPDDVQFTFEELQAGVDEAHRLNRAVAVHAHPKAAMLTAIRAGVDFIEHATFIDDEVIAACLERDVVIVPTFCVYKRISMSTELPRPMVENAMRIYEEKLQRFDLARRAGVRWGVGLDNGTYYPPHDYVTELECLVEAGVSPEEALHVATDGNAGLLNMGTEIGSITQGKKADLVVLRNDPLKDLNSMREPVMVVKNGRPYWGGQTTAFPPSFEAMPSEVGLVTESVNI